MKKLFISCCLAIITCVGYAQTEKTTEKTITVTGTAEMEVVPDEITFVIGIMEYWEEEFENKKEKKYKTKVTIDNIENDLLNKLTAIGINKKQIALGKVGNNWRKKGLEFLFAKELQIKLTDFSKINQIIESVDSKGIAYMRVANATNKNIVNYRKEVKIKAIKAAKDKATYLLESIDEKLGGAITINEYARYNDQANDYNYYRANTYIKNSLDDTPKNETIDIEQFKKIKIEYSIKVVFAIQ